MSDAYGDDLAFIHDAGFGKYAENAAPVVLDALRKQGFAQGLVIDLGCGSGILARELTDAGYDVLGIDFSPAMIALASKDAPQAEFRVDSLLTAELPACVAVTAIGECVNYLFDARNNDAALKKLLRRIHRALSPGGVLLFDIAGPGRIPGKGESKTFIERDGWTVLVTASECRETCMLTRRITSFRRVGETYRRTEESHRLRLIPRAEMAAELRTLGFRVRTLRGYGPFMFPRGAAGFLARKPN